MIEIEIKYLTHFVTQPAGGESRQSSCQLKIKRSQALAEKEVPLLLISLSLCWSFALFKSTHLKKNLIGYLAAAKPVIGKSTPFLSSPSYSLSLFGLKGIISQWRNGRDEIMGFGERRVLLRRKSRGWVREMSITGELSSGRCQDSERLEWTPTLARFSDCRPINKFCSVFDLTSIKMSFQQLKVKIPPKAKIQWVI